MIESFKHKGLRRLFENDDRSKLPSDMVETIEEILFALDAAQDVQQMALPQYRLHPLKGDRKGFWSVRVQSNWRIIFRFEDGNALDVEFIDYH